MISEHTHNDTQSRSASHDDELLGVASEQERAHQLIEHALADIADVEERIVRDLGVAPHSAEAVAATDEALVYIARESNGSHDVPELTAHDAAMDVVVEGALESSGAKFSGHDNPAATLDHDGEMHARITELVQELHDTHATLPDGTDAAEAAILAIEQHPIMQQGVRGVEYANSDKTLQNDKYQGHDVSTELRAMSNRWRHEGGSLVERNFSAIERSTQASRVIESSGYVGDKGLEATVHAATGALEATAALNNTKLQKEIDHLAGLIESRIQAGSEIPAPMQAAKDALEARISTAGDVSKHPSVIAAVRQELADQEKHALQEQIEARLHADELPWTMPDAQIPADMMDGIRVTYESMFTQESILSDSDQIKVAPPMENFERATQYTPEDEALLATGGIDLSSRGSGVQPNHFTRGELKAANVFFVNRLGAGEQAIFGIPIPDAQSEGGIFNVQDRSFLTEEEFKKVYDYQQANGYGLDGKSPRDVQTDMMMYAIRPESRSAVTPLKGSGFSTRENKYNDARSPFVDSGFSLKHGVETYAPMPDGTKQRINTMTIHMVGHEKYPGISEMFDPATVDHGQMYMSAGEFIRNFYVPPPTEEEALLAMQSNGGRTARERSWVGPLPDSE